MIGYNVKIIGPETTHIMRMLMKAQCIFFPSNLNVSQPPSLSKTAYLKIGKGDEKRLPPDQDVKISHSKKEEPEDLDTIIIAVKESDLNDYVMLEYFDQVKENRGTVYLFVTNSTLKKHTAKKKLFPPVSTMAWAIDDDTDFKKLFSQIYFQLASETLMSVSLLKLISFEQLLTNATRLSLFNRHSSNQPASVSALTIPGNDGHNTTAENLTTKVDDNTSSPISTQEPNSTSPGNSIGGNEDSATITEGHGPITVETQYDIDDWVEVSDDDNWEKIEFNGPQ